MPVVFYNRATAKFVMQYWSSRCGFVSPCADMAVADSPYGPFKMVPPIQLHGGTPSSQLGFFVDPSTQKGYVKYNTHPPDQHHAVELLNDDWLSSTGQWAVLLWKPSFAWMEGGGMFKRGVRFLRAPPAWQRVHKTYCNRTARAPSLPTLNAATQTP